MLRQLAGFSGLFGLNMLFGLAGLFGLIGLAGLLRLRSHSLFRELRVDLDMFLNMILNRMNMKIMRNSKTKIPAMGTIGIDFPAKAVISIDIVPSLGWQVANRGGRGNRTPHKL